MLDHRTPAHFEVQYRTLVLRCQAFSGEGDVLELLAIEIPALEIRIVAGVDHHRNVPDPARGVQTSIAQSASYVDRAISARRTSTLHRATERRADDDKGRPTPRINPSTRIYRYQHGQRWIAADYEFFIQTAVVKSVWLVFGVAWAGPRQLNQLGLARRRAENHCAVGGPGVAADAAASAV